MPVGAAQILDVYDLGDHVVAAILMDDDRPASWGVLPSVSAALDAAFRTGDLASDASVPDRTGNVAATSQGFLARRAVGIRVVRSGLGWDVGLRVPDPRRGVFLPGDLVVGFSRDAPIELVARACGDILRQFGDDDSPPAAVHPPNEPREELVASLSRPGTCGVWLALDDGGNIGVFVSDESGAVPVELITRDVDPHPRTGAPCIRPDLSARESRLLDCAQEGGTGGALREPRLAVPPDTRAVCCRALLRSGLPRHLLVDHCAGLEIPPSALHLDCSSTHRQSDRIVRVTRTTTWFSELSTSGARDLHSSDGVVAAARTARTDLERALWAACGYYVFEHVCDGWASGPYGRVYSPEHPVTLPVGERSATVRLHLRVDFSASPYLDPAALRECYVPLAPYLPWTP